VRDCFQTLEACFAPGEIETLIRSAAPGEHDPAVRIIHRPTGRTVESSQLSTQIDNKAAALLTLISELLTSPEGTDTGQGRV
jgi:protein subunit release factor A